MWELDHKKAERCRTDAFEPWCWRRLLRVPWIVRGSNQSILKEINPEYSLEGLMLKLKLRYSGHLMWRVDSLRARGEGGNRGRDGWKASPTQWTGAWASSGRWWKTGTPSVLPSTSRRVRHDLGTENHHHKISRFQGYVFWNFRHTINRRLFIVLTRQSSG